MSLILHGPTRCGKSELMRTFGHHAWMVQRTNFKLLTPEVKYVIFDDIPWWEWTLSLQKAFLGCQKRIQINQKYCHIMDLHWGKPAIFINNEIPFYSFSKELRDFIEGNSVIVEIKERLF